MSVKRLKSTLLGVLGMPLDCMARVGRDPFQESCVFLLLLNEIVKSYWKMATLPEGLCCRRVCECCLGLLRYCQLHTCQQAEWPTGWRHYWNGWVCVKQSLKTRLMDGPKCDGAQFLSPGEKMFWDRRKVYSVIAGEEWKAKF